MTARPKLGTVILLFGYLFLVAMGWPDGGTDYDSYRCSGELVEMGDSVQNVIERCGAPIDDTQIDPHPNRILVYRFDDTRFLYLFSFLRDRLSRIYAVDCTEDIAYCN